MGGEVSRDDEPLVLRAPVERDGVEPFRADLSPPRKTAPSVVGLVVRIGAGALILATLLHLTFGIYGRSLLDDIGAAVSWSQVDERNSQPAAELAPTGNEEQLDRLIKQQACNQPAVLEKMRLLYGRFDFGSAAQLGQGFLDRCDRNAEIGFTTMESWFRVSQFEKAMAVIDRFPDEARYYSDLARFCARKTWSQSRGCGSI